VQTSVGTTKIYTIIQSANLLLVEVAPVYDNNGETTVLAAAEVALALIGLMVKKPVSGLE
jgi:hypothetical protein